MEVKSGLPPYGKNVLIAGTSGSGKSVGGREPTERLADAKYQYAVIDPDGDYPALPGAVVLGSAKQPPLLEEVLTLLESGRKRARQSDRRCAADRPAIFDHLFLKLLDSVAAWGGPTGSSSTRLTT